MNENQLDYAWESRPRVRLLGQPIGLGIPLALMGGVLTVNMFLALFMERNVLMWIITLLMFAACAVMFGLGVAFLLAPFEKVWVCPKEVQLRLGKLVLRRIPVENIRSVGATTREIIVRNKDQVLYRIKIFCNGKWPRNRTLWLDWSIETEAALRRNLTEITFLL